MSAILVSNGLMLDPFDLPQQRPPRNIFTRSMAMLNRYTGHTIRPLSVAEHTVKLATSRQVVNRGLQRAAILHDFNEPLTNDLPHPFKPKLPDFMSMEKSVQVRVFEWWDEPWENMEAIIEFDRRICCDEMSQLFNPKVDPWMEPLGVQYDLFETNWGYWNRRLNALCEEFGVH